MTAGVDAASSVAPSGGPTRGSTPGTARTGTLKVVELFAGVGGFRLGLVD